MAAFISIKADGESVAMQVLQQLADFDKRKDEMFTEIGGYGVSSSQMRFVNQNDVDGNPWKQSWRAQLQGGQTLRDTGRLMNGLNFQTLSNGVEWGSGEEYAAMMHFGGTILPKTADYLTFNVAGNWRKVKSVEVPPRTYLGINSEDEENILDIIGRFILV
ncbi:phage virion morphogenesis protein [Acinetobacter ursingii]|uniref:phage virion morphogenesis protein n=1 Tax=Acinetobacter ursingii TaxID=108980 RepID=UPI0021CD4E60|nr:phage virion morphogenesis protein [Acinetobacter ursingii]MCU4521939.1 phage virion morphogenesis protein [Acinetobacter ursingii]